MRFNTATTAGQIAQATLSDMQNAVPSADFPSVVRMTLATLCGTAEREIRAHLEGEDSEDPTARAPLLIAMATAALEIIGQLRKPVRDCSKFKERAEVILQRVAAAQTAWDEGSYIDRVVMSAGTRAFVDAQDGKWSRCDLRKGWRHPSHKPRVLPAGKLVEKLSRQVSNDNTARLAA